MNEPGGAPGATARLPNVPASERDQWGKGPPPPEEIHFLQGPQKRSFELGRALRIFFELLSGFRALHFVGPCVTVFGSARFKEDHIYYGVARQVGALLARAGFTVMTGGGPGIKIVPPFGLDSYVLLTTTEQLPDPGLLEFDPVLTRGARGPSSPLGDLLSSASSGRRGMERPVPSNWAVHYLQIRSTALGTASAK